MCVCLFCVLINDVDDDDDDDDDDEDDNTNNNNNIISKNSYIFYPFAIETAGTCHVTWL